MRATALGLCSACLLLTALGHSSAQASAGIPTDADAAALMQIEAIQDRSADRWQGRHHYLYDDEYQPNSGTVGAASNARACAREPLRMRRSDGSTVVRHVNRCK